MPYMPFFIQLTEFPPKARGSMPNKLVSTRRIPKDRESPPKARGSMPNMLSITQKSQTIAQRLDSIASDAPLHPSSTCVDLKSPFNECQSPPTRTSPSTHPQTSPNPALQRLSPIEKAPIASPITRSSEYQQIRIPMSASEKHPSHPKSHHSIVHAYQPMPRLLS